MDKHYQELFKLISQSAEVLAETALEQNEQSNDEKGIHAATIMHDDYSRLTDLFGSKDFDASTLTKSDYAKLLVGVYFVVTNISARIECEKKALDGYKIDLIPKLDRLLNTEEGEDFNTLAQELFSQVEEN